MLPSFNRNHFVGRLYVNDEGNQQEAAFARVPDCDLYEKISAGNPASAPSVGQSSCVSPLLRGMSELSEDRSHIHIRSVSRPAFVPHIQEVI
jgi:hypothetical protein